MAIKLVFPTVTVAKSYLHKEIDFKKGMTAEYFDMCRKENLLLVPGASNTVRILPPLTITNKEIKEAIIRLERALLEMRKFNE